jgi:radical SAM protein with 4Fe4S-binding SPASM domain
MADNFEGFPVIMGWELTLACNLRCRHCASSAGRPRDRELTLQESLAICDQLPELLTLEVVFTGGEPLLSPNWEPIALRLRDLGLRVGMVTNATLVTPDNISRMWDAGVTALAISVDGLEKTHDALRDSPGLHRRVTDGIQRLVAAGFHVTVITTVHSANVGELEDLLGWLRSMGIRKWQLQPIFAFGRTRDSHNLILTEDDYLLLGRFVERSYSIAREWGLELCPADGVGYFSTIDVPGPRWRGCSAGIMTCGIMSDGRVKGCLSWPDSLVEGDLRKDNFWDIWFRPGAFAQTRQFRASDLRGACSGCDVGDECGGGCSATSLAATGQFHADPYCFRSILARRAAETGRPIQLAAAGPAVRA